MRRIEDTVAQRLKALNDGLQNKSKFDEGRNEILNILSSAEEDLNQLSGTIGHKLDDAQNVLERSKA